MNADQRIRYIIGDMVIGNAVLQDQLETERSKRKEAEKALELSKLSHPDPAFEEPA